MISNVTSSNPAFLGRNPEIKHAEKILRKINQDFTSISPNFKNLKNSNYVNEWYDLKFSVFNKILEYFKNKTSSNYISTIIEGIKHFKVAKNKELAELAYIIAKTNNIENGYCANLHQVSYFPTKSEDLEHSIFIINQTKLYQKSSSKTKKSKKRRFPHHNYIVPNKKAIVVDPTLGIVDYWQNIKSLYAQTGIFELNQNSNLMISLNNPLLTTEKDVKKIKKMYPLVSFDNKSKKIANKIDFSTGDVFLNKIKNNNTSFRLLNVVSSTNNNSDSIQNKNSIIEMFKRLWSKF